VGRRVKTGGNVVPGMKPNGLGGKCASALAVACFGKRTVLCTRLTGAGRGANRQQEESSERR